MKILFSSKRLYCMWVGIFVTIVILYVVFQGQVSSHPYRIGTQLYRSATKKLDNSPEVPSRKGEHHFHFETGIVFPRWGASAYSKQDANWLKGLREITDQTAAKWITLTINLHQTSEFATQVIEAPDTPTPASIAAGTSIAKRLGYHVFISPMITVDSGHAWSGVIHFSSLAQTQVWFNSYWLVMRPYVVAAQNAGAEQLAVGNEYSELENAPSFLWQQLLQRTRKIFSGRLVYNINWTSLQKPIMAWMYDSNLDAIGVSTYIPLATTPQMLDPHQLPALWHEKISSVLDNFAVQLNIPLFLSEIGYRDSAFAGYNPWQLLMNEPRDDGEQAALFDAAMQNIVADPHIAGIFVWAWSFPPFSPNGKPAARVLYHWYIAQAYSDK